MKKNLRTQSKKEMQLLKPEEMLLIRGGGEPKRPKSSDEAIILV